MAYNYGFPVNYQSYFPQMQSNNVQQQNNSLIWVQGEAGAKSYMVAPNTTVALWDSEAQTVYLKSADASGMPSMRILDYSIRTDAPKSPILPSQSDFVTKDEFSILQKQIDEIKANMGTGKEMSYEPSVQSA